MNITENIFFHIFHIESFFTILRKPLTSKMKVDKISVLEVFACYPCPHNLEMRGFCCQLYLECHPIHNLYCLRKHDSISTVKHQVISWRHKKVGFNRWNVNICKLTISLIHFHILHLYSLIPFDQLYPNIKTHEVHN